MKFSLFALSAVIGSAAAGRPILSVCSTFELGINRVTFHPLANVLSFVVNLQISVHDGSFDGLDGLDPTLSWEGSASPGDIDLDYGIEAAARPTTDVASLPRNVWGKASTSIGDWGISARAEKNMQDGSDTAIELDVDNDDIDLSLRVTASAGDGVAVESVQATKGLDLDDSRVTINPRYNLETEEADVVIGYSKDSTDVTLTASIDNQEVNIKHDMGDTKVEVTASRENQEVIVDHTMDNTNLKLTASIDNQELTVSQQIDDDNRISPTINRNGDISVEWERSLGDDSSLTATLKPNDSLAVEWKDGDWTANVDMVMDGVNIDGASVSIKRDVTF